MGEKIKINPELEIISLEDFSTMLLLKAYKDVYVKNLGLVIAYKGYFIPNPDFLSNKKLNVDFYNNDHNKFVSAQLPYKFVPLNHILVYPDPNEDFLRLLMQAKYKSSSSIWDIILNFIEKLKASNKSFWNSAGGFYFYDSSGSTRSDYNSVRKSSAPGEWIDIAGLKAMGSFSTTANTSFKNNNSSKNIAVYLKNTIHGYQVGENVGKVVEDGFKNRKQSKSPQNINVNVEDTIYQKRQFFIIAPRAHLSNEGFVYSRGPLKDTLIKKYDIELVKSMEKTDSINKSNKLKKLNNELKNKR